MSNVRPSELSDEEKQLVFMEAYSAAPERITAEALTLLQKRIGAGNAARGFHDEGDTLREEAAEAYVSPLRNYYITKLALVMSEGAEAIEELRNGRAVDETYYSVNGQNVRSAEHRGDGSDWEVIGNESVTFTGIAGKPEGVPSEIADIVIRCFDFADEAGFSLGEIILEKLAYNATRGRMHGGKKV